MKSDNEQLVCDSVLPHEHGSKPSEEDATEPKLGDAKENLNLTVFDLRGDGGNEDRVNVYGRNIEEPDSSDDDEKGDEGSVTSDSHSSTQEDSFRKDSVVYTDKSITECDLPEITVCYKESVVKDICMDEGAPALDKFLFDNGVGEKGVRLSENGEQERETSDIPVTIQHVLKDNSAAYISVQLADVDSMKTKDVKNDGASKTRTSNVEKSSTENDSYTDFAVQYDSRAAKVIKDSRHDASEEVIVSQSDKPTTDPQSLMLSSKAENDSRTKATMGDADMVTIEVSAPSTENFSKKDIQRECDSKDLMLREEEKHDASLVDTVDNISREAVTLGDMLSMEKLDRQPCKTSNYEPQEPSSKSLSGNRSVETAAVIPKVEVPKRTDQELLKMNPENFVHVAKESNKGEEETNIASLGPASTEENFNSQKHTNSANPFIISTSQESINTDTAEALQDSKSDNAATTGDHDSTATLPNGSSEAPCNSISESHDLKHGCAFEDTNDQTSSRIRNSLGETSFSAAVPVSGLITYSGPITYSGSLSIRSDSSTTSTRSFAFPVLQSEWNSSPVRMAKADRRRFWRQRRWRQGLLCCKF